MTDIQKRISEPMSNEDLEKYLSVKPSDIMKYGDLSNYQSIEQLLPKDGDFQIILIEDKQNSGHWVVTVRNGILTGVLFLAWFVSFWVKIPTT